MKDIYIIFDIVKGVGTVGFELTDEQAQSINDLFENSEIDCRYTLICDDEERPEM